MSSAKQIPFTLLLITKINCMGYFLPKTISKPKYYCVGDFSINTFIEKYKSRGRHLAYSKANKDNRKNT